jgi:hypothetical protein
MRTRESLSCLWGLLCVFSLASSTAGEKDITVKSSAREITISVVERVDRQYYLLEKEKPVEIEVTGPTWLRVYTRLFWTEKLTGNQSYKIILQEDDEQEKVITKETEKSSTARGSSNSSFSEWRSFFIDVPSGTHHYRFILWRSPSEKVALRFAFEAPPTWSDVTPSTYHSAVQTVEEELIVAYYCASAKKPVTVTIEGPQRLKVTARLNYGSTVEGEQNYTITVREGKQVLETASFKTYKSETIRYTGKTDLIPSKSDVFYLDIPPGKHHLTFAMEGLAASAALRIEMKEE